MNYLVPVLILAVGTFAFRTIGPMLRSRVTLSARVDAWTNMSVAVIFVALVATSALVVDQQFAGFALPVGVLVALVLAWRKAPFVVIVLAASATTAALRLL